MDEASIGIAGLGVMGENLALNIANHGFSLVAFNRTEERTRRFLAGPAQGKPITGAFTLQEFAQKLARPRRIILMVQAGKAVDDVLAQLRPHLEPGDVVMDGGNSHFRDTQRRSKEMAAAGIHYFGVGISGGEEGALRGPSLMPGGPAEAYQLIEPVLTAIAARSDDGPCVTYVGPDGAGHYVKMVHNGIEYGDMQLIAEAYDLMRRVLRMPAPDIGAVFDRWNQGVLRSYLVEITGHVLARRDPETGLPLVDVILDAAGQKGTGRWTSQEAAELGVPIPTIDAALWARNISALKAERVSASDELPGPTGEVSVDANEFIEAIHDALYSAKICSYAQGMALLRVASRDYGFNLNFAEIARIWKAGCIIRARLLEPIKQAFVRNPDLPNLLLDPTFRDEVASRQARWRMVVQTARVAGVPVPAFSASLDYYDSYRQANLPANLIQGLRDYFGAHTYQRVDRPGTFHTEWQAE